MHHFSAFQVWTKLAQLHLRNALVLMDSAAGLHIRKHNFVTDMDAEQHRDIISRIPDRYARTVTDQSWLRLACCARKLISLPYLSGALVRSSSTPVWRSDKRGVERDSESA